MRGLNLSFRILFLLWQLGQVWSIELSSLSISIGKGCMFNMFIWDFNENITYQTFYIYISTRNAKSNPLVYKSFLMRHWRIFFCFFPPTPTRYLSSTGWTTRGLCGVFPNHNEKDDFYSSSDNWLWCSDLQFISNIKMLTMFFESASAKGMVAVDHANKAAAAAEKAVGGDELAPILKCATAQSEVDFPPIPPSPCLQWILYKNHHHFFGFLMVGCYCFF